MRKAFASPAKRGKLPRRGLKEALLILLEASRSKSRAAPFRVCRPTFPRCAGEGTAIVCAVELVLSLPPFTGEAPPKGVKGLLLILLEASRSKSKACPLPGLRPTFPRFAGEGTAIVCAVKLVLSLPPFTGEAPPKGVKGAALDLA